MTTTPSITIVGGGFIGCLAAIAFAKQGFSLHIIEAQVPQTSTDPRGIALNVGSCEFLDHLGVWSNIKNHAQAIKQVHISNKGSFSKVRFNAKDFQQEALGYVIEGHALLQILEERTRQFNNIHWHRPSKLKALNKNSVGYHVVTEDSTINCELLIAADGQNSLTRKLLNIETESKDHEQSALLCNITLEKTHQNIAYERFTDEGVIALLPLTKQLYKVVITANKEKIAQWQALSDTDFLAKLQTQFGNFLGPFTHTSKRIHYPLVNIIAKQQTAQDAVLLGNAAHAIHPIAAQGLNLAIKDLKCLVHCLQQGNTLHDYETKIAKHQQQTLQFTNFLTQLKPGLLQRTAFIAAEFCPPLQNKIAENAMGL